MGEGPAVASSDVYVSPHTWLQVVNLLMHGSQGTADCKLHGISRQHLTDTARTCSYISEVCDVCPRSNHQQFASSTLSCTAGHQGFQAPSSLAMCLNSSHCLSVAGYMKRHAWPLLLIALAAAVNSLQCVGASSDSTSSSQAIQQTCGGLKQKCCPRCPAGTSKNGEHKAVPWQPFCSGRCTVV